MRRNLKAIRKKFTAEAKGRTGENPKVWDRLWAAVIGTAAGDSSFKELSEAAGLDPTAVIAWFSDPDFANWFSGEVQNYVQVSLRLWGIKMAAQVLEGKPVPLKVIEHLAKMYDPDFAERKIIEHEHKMPDFGSMKPHALAAYAIAVMPSFLRTEMPVTQLLEQADDEPPEPKKIPGDSDGGNRGSGGEVGETRNAG